VSSKITGGVLLAIDLQALASWRIADAIRACHSLPDASMSETSDQTGLVK
jgi:hypothetical protein